MRTDQSASKLFFELVAIGETVRSPASMVLGLNELLDTGSQGCVIEIWEDFLCHREVEVVFVRHRTNQVKPGSFETFAQKAAGCIRTLGQVSNEFLEPGKLICM